MGWNARRPTWYYRFTWHVFLSHYRIFFTLSTKPQTTHQQASLNNLTTIITIIHATHGPSCLSSSVASSLLLGNSNMKTDQQVYSRSKKRQTECICVTTAIEPMKQTELVVAVSASFGEVNLLLVMFIHHIITIVIQADNHNHNQCNCRPRGGVNGQADVNSWLTLTVIKSKIPYGKEADSTYVVDYDRGLPCCNWQHG